ncbi:4Fe-4S binding protein [Solidesulfovibrio sp.]|uniref:4Fe-4S binding protein n=1 Tax=Solidesulfovibrio sp. TaxID=2910990 RepID=UPI00262309AD|nr:4Fe-4S binding protein [Solidesulfovibrio sp.]
MMRARIMRLVYFSPTGTSRRIVRGIGQGLGLKTCEELDLTGPARLAAPPSDKDVLTVVGAPVYAGRLPAEAVHRLRRLRGAGGPAVVTVTYGNRAFEDALLELRDLAGELGFVPVGGGAFVGEHSYSSPETPIASGRPDGKDLRAARDFGRAVAAKLGWLGDLAAWTPLSVPGDFPYRESGLSGGVAPRTLPELCEACGQCATACPMGGIRLDGGAVLTEAARCIRCCACVKGCPSGARVFDHPALLETARRLAATCRERREPETFL